ncbi:MAG: UDP-N-acetylmuramoyl-L-alanyl-D-glutamate--2,6-diaminopimelate ligase [Deltaproteobacteria bacterium]|nr:UDP-N-acetylmuramoyl-L-alanyl-D-glutamate--2,6-diaminopimelate ligase [Deltaproteobacteria bacterium]
MRLEVLLTSLNGIELASRCDGSAELVSCVDDHRAARAGSLFVALKGARMDGHDWAAAALGQGATGVLLDRTDVAGSLAAAFPDRAVLLARNTRELAGPAAAAISGYPGRSLRSAGVTGTNGKTTTAFLLESVFQVADLAPALVGTVGTRWPGHAAESAQTTPGAAALQGLLASAVKAGARSLSIEISSHAIDQWRADGLDLDCAVFTNLTRDHLDYHGGMDRYFAAKAAMFTRLLVQSVKRPRTAVINLDDPYGRRLAGMVPAEVERVLLYSCEAGTGAQVWAESYELSASGIRASVITPAGKLELRSRLLGAYNLSNLLGALAAGIGMDIPPETVIRGLELAPPPPGRLERVDGGAGFEVLVDYAHTPDALEKVLVTLRPLAGGRLITVFGCGGDRDATKRPEMAAAAARYSDLVVLTSDNPRTEDPERILDACEAGFAAENFPAASGGMTRGYVRIADRQAAIGEAVRRARPGDIVLIAGKGHETCQIIGTEKRPFDDRLEAALALRSKREGRS